MIKIIDYRAGNAPSVMRAVERLGLTAEFARSGDELCGASHIILPGVGSARATMDSLSEMGITAPLTQLVLTEKVKFLGICVGMQILFEHSEEEDADCLGWLSGEVVKFDKASVRVPQMGWNCVNFVKDTAVSVSDDYFYFVNSYYAKPAQKQDIWGVSDYNGVFTAAVNRDNIFGAQFHVEKSGDAGLGLLNNFLRLSREG